MPTQRRQIVDSSPLTLACSEGNLTWIREIMQELVEKTDWKNAYGALRHANSGFHGRLREVLFKLLDLDALLGADFDSQVVFAGLNGFSLEEVRAQAVDESIYILRRQVKHGNTFLLDITGMGDSRLVVLVPKILEVRQQEILDLPAEPSMTQVLATYYGFKTFTSIVSNNIIDPDLRPAKDAFERMADELGNPIRIRKVRPYFTCPIWKNVSESMYQLLHNLTRLAMTGWMTKCKAARYFRETPDPRALETLQLVSNVWVHKEVTKAVGNAIGWVTTCQMKEKEMDLTILERKAIITYA